jgi:DNA modification methylase
MSVRILIGDALTELRKLPDESVHCCVTSPPYYGLCAITAWANVGIGLEPSPDEYVAALVSVFREVRRVLRKDATLWLNIGDSYAIAAKRDTIRHVHRTQNRRRKPRSIRQTQPIRRVASRKT